MQCPSCHKTGFVNIGNKRYCSHCGTKLTDQAAPRAISDLKPAAKAPVTATAQTATGSLPTPGTVVNPAQNPMSTTNSAVSQPKPATQFHGRQVGSSAPAVLDLRPKAAPQVQKPSPAAAPANLSPVTAPTAVSTVPQPPVAQATPAVTAPAPAPIKTTPTVAPAASPAPNLPVNPISTAAPSKSTPPPIQVQPAIAKPAPVVAATQPAAALKPDTTKTQTHPMVKRFPTHPAVANAQPAPAAPATNMPNEVATQIDAMRNLITEGDTTPKSPALQQVLASAKPSSGPKLTQIAAAIAVIAIMGGVVWMQNSPKMAFRAAASQAGIEASLPTYIPSSYRQAGPATVSPGQLTLTFNSPSSQTPLQISQKRTNWDSNSLRENYVSRQSDSMLAVQGQGLTIFLYNNSASWVNHGIWYTINGTDNLSREQILRVAYGL